MSRPAGPFAGSAGLQGTNRSEDLGQEGLRACVLRVHQHLTRQTGLDHHTVVHEDETVAHLPREGSEPGA